MGKNEFFEDVLCAVREQIPEEIKDVLIMELLDEARNKERLKSLIYKGVGNGFVMVPYITIKELGESAMRTAVTKDMARLYNYDIDELMDYAFINTMAEFKPAFIDANKLHEQQDACDFLNPMDEDFKIDAGSTLYILTNSRGHYGATVFFYPGVAEKLGEILGRSYYVLPSSVHEMMIVPEGRGSSIKELKKLVRDANKTVVDPREVLSDKVLFYDRRKNMLRRV